MNRPPGAARMRRLAKTTTAISSDLGFRISERSPAGEIPLTLQTDLVVAGGRVYIRTRRAVPPVSEPRPVAPEAEP